MKLTTALLFLLLALPAHADLTLREDTATQAVVVGPFVDTAGAIVASLTIDAADVRLSKNGANIVGKNSGGCTYDEVGMYACTFDATDSNTVGRLQVTIVETGALPVYHEFQVVEEAVFDACCAAGATPNTAAATATAIANLDVSDNDDVADSWGERVARIPNAVAGAAGGIFIAGTNAATAVTTGFTATFTGNLTGSVGSIGTGGIATTSFASGAINAAAVAPDAIGASELAADAATEIGTATWATTTRLLTAGTNIVLAKGTGVTGFTDLDAADIRTAVGLASGNLDTQLGAIISSLTTIDDFIDLEIAAIKAKTDQLVFGVTGAVNTNVTHQTEIEICGLGTEASPWGACP